MSNSDYKILNRLAYFEPKFLDIALVACGDKHQIAVLGIKDIEAFNLYLNYKNDGSFTLPDGIDFIGDEAFKNCNQLKHLELSKDIKQIGRSAFENTGLLDVDFSNCENLFYIDDYAFYRANLQSTIDLTPCKKVFYIGERAFGNNYCDKVLIDSETMHFHAGEGAFSRAGIGGNTAIVDYSGEQLRLF